MNTLPRIQFGNPVLRKQARQLSGEEINSSEIRMLIKNMRRMLAAKKLGVGLAAPQVGKSLALAVIAIRPMPHRPKAKLFDLTLINPVITEHKGQKKSLWEGCISSGSHGKADLFAKVPRYTQIKVKYLDENGQEHHKTFKGLKAHVIQHEIDHLKGVLFVDRVKNTKTFMTYKEYMNRIKKPA